jgi:exopolyphosphatase / guanosine-5'-triphosphate,3'-diphosphate pyrophosphatase
VNGRRAVIDLGSLSTRLLLLADGRERREQVVTRLGAGAGPDGALAADALDRVGRALEGFATAMGEVDDLVVVATAAARRAPNVDALVDVVRRVLGVEPLVLSAAEEARLAFAGAVNDLGGAGPLMVLDIGGGSTEVSVGDRDGLRSSWSAELGAGTLTEAYLHADPPDPWELSAALSVVELHVDDVIREVDGLGEVLRDGRVIAVGGTVTTVAAVELGLDQYEPSRLHHVILTREAVEDVFRTIATESAADRAHNPGLPADRVDVIVGGCCVLVEIMRRLGIDEVVVSERDLLDGVAARWTDPE